ncbi:STAS domain-containing protein [Streptosporangium sp. NPDC003464]
MSATDYRSCSVITITGDLDALSADLLRQVVADAIARGHVRLVVDVAGLTFCDLDGVHALAEAHRSTAALGRHLSLVYVHGTLKRILDISRQTDGLLLGMLTGLSGLPTTAEEGPIPVEVRIPTGRPDTPGTGRVSPMWLVVGRLPILRGSAGASEPPPEAVGGGLFNVAHGDGYAKTWAVLGCAGGAGPTAACSGDFGLGTGRGGPRAGDYRGGISGG